MTKDKQTDWAAIEREYRLGHASTREIARRFGVSNSHLCRKILKEGWTQDKAPEVQRRVAKQLLIAGPKEGTGDKRGQRQGDSRGQSEPSDADIDRAAGEQVSIHVAHRDLASRTRRLALKLLDEAEEGIDNVEVIEDAIIESTRGSGHAEIRRMMKRAVSLPTRAGVLNSIASIVQKVQFVERLSHNLTPALPHDGERAEVGGYTIIEYDGMKEKPYEPPKK